MDRLCDMSQRIRIAYENSSNLARMEGENWYPTARRFARDIATQYGYTTHQAAGVIAALSPRMQWSANQTMAKRALHAHAMGLDHKDVKLNFTHCNVKAWAILDGTRPLSVLGGPKVRNFYRNITGDYDAVTVDVWAWRVCLPMEYYTPSRAKYDKIAQAYVNTANRLGMEPAILQAITWVHTRNGG